MLSHACVGVNDFERAFAFYEVIFVHLDVALKIVDRKRPWAVWMKPGLARPLFLLGRPFDGEIAAPGNGQMTAFLAPSRAAVDRCYEAALSGGGACEGPPELRPEYHANYYGAYFCDPEGNKLCAVCHDPV
jgi:catechol 2,3-dioxygenase-like lactoylglutathione lyase family enzyme